MHSAFYFVGWSVKSVEITAKMEIILKDGESEKKMARRN